MRKRWRWKSVQSKPICKRTSRSARGAFGSYEKAPPEHRVDPPNPDVDTVSFGLRIAFHYGGQPIRWKTPRLFLAPALKCSPIGDDGLSSNLGIGLMLINELHQFMRLINPA